VAFFFELLHSLFVEFSLILYKQNQMSKNIVVLGLGQNNFLSYLYSALKIHHNDYQITAPYIKDLNDESKDESWMYDNQKVVFNPHLGYYVYSFLRILFNRYTYIFFHYLIFVEGNWKKAFHFLFQFLKEQAFLKANNSFEDFSIAHFHFMQYSYVRNVFLLPKEKKIICSFWGSDLLRTSDHFNHFIIQKVLNRAAIITCQTPEMKEIILAKYGRALEDKIRLNLFPLDRFTYENIDLYRNDELEIQEFKSKFGFHPTKKNILIGHNGNQSNQQIAVIQELSKLNNSKDYHLIVNLNYGCPPKELEAFKVILEKHLIASNTTYYINQHFYNKKELALSRLATDIFIHVPISDALSGSVLEMLYANTQVITGSWLNYKTFKNANLDYLEIQTIYELIELFTNPVIANSTASNVNKVKENFNNAAIIARWHQTFQEL
jgi:hypothetical protein